MQTQWNKMDKTAVPTMDIIDGYVASPLWHSLRAYLAQAYAAAPRVEYSGCSVPGWNVKYKKAGRGLCTLYPMQGWFIALVVVGEREKAEVELALPTLSAYTQGVYRQTKEGMGQRWLMLRVDSEAVLHDVQRLIAIRRRPAGPPQ